jgi:hypothetical protein
MKIFKLLPIFMLLLMGVSCTKVKTISTKEHSFNTYPEKLILLQVPGLSEEHLAYLRYKKPLFRNKTWAENFSCFGKMWRYNLYDIRPSIEEGVVSQITGHSGSNGRCDKYDSSSLWSVLDKFNYLSAVVERGNSSTFKKAMNCNSKFYKDASVFISAIGSKKNGKSSFHHQREAEYKKGEVYFDESCSGANCFSKSSEVFFHIMNSLNERPKNLIVFKDYSLLNAIKTNNRKAFFEYLEELDELINDINSQILSKNSDALLVVSSTSPMKIEWPQSSKNWKRINLLKSTREGDLLAPIWATGAMAENFCGMYAESEVFNRMFWRPKKTQIPLLDALGY